MDMTEKTLESREVYRGRILRVREDRVRLPNGKEGVREVAHTAWRCQTHVSPFPEQR